MQQYGLSKILVLAAVVLMPVFLLFGCSKKIEENVDVNLFTDLYTDKSRYLPNDTVNVTINLRNTGETVQKGTIQLKLHYLNQTAMVFGEQEVSIEKGERKNLNVAFTAPAADFKGYILEANFIQNNQTVDTFASAVDVSSDWSKFPRYGYFVDYSDKTQEQIDLILDNLTKYHVNGIQFYDWQYKHHLPVLLDENNAPASRWFELSNRYVYADTVQKYIDTAHTRNMMAMNYNLLFGTYENPESDGVNMDWGMYTDQAGTAVDYHPVPSEWQSSKILLMDAANQDWQNYIFEKERQAMELFNFDGWHVDQLGDRGARFTKEGESINLIDGYVNLLNNAKRELDTRLVFNAVDGFSQDTIAEEVDVDFLYTEVWSSKTYYSLQRIINAGFERSNNEKSMILAAYMNYESRNKQGYFNSPSVLLTDAVIFASGGAHLELGDTGMLSSEYFPSNNLMMSNDLRLRLRNYYSFAVGYQNFLRDDVNDIKSTVDLGEDIITSRIGNRNSVWYFAKEKGNHQFLHLINLLNNENDWRDDEQDKKAAPIQEKLEVKYYTNKDVNNVMVASPDFNTILPVTLDFKAAEDKDGKYIIFTLPSLEYWDMVIIENK